MNLEQLAELAGRAGAESRLAEAHYANALDASQQTRNRQEALTKVSRLLLEGNPEQAARVVADIRTHCPSMDSVIEWYAQARTMLEQAAQTRAELAEGIEKLRELEEARVQHGGTA